MVSVLAPFLQRPKTKQKDRVWVTLQDLPHHKAKFLEHQSSLLARVRRYII